MDDITNFTEDELIEYGSKRMRAMLKLERDATRWLQKKNTPFQQLILETARHHLDRCEKQYGISRYDIRLR